VVLLVGFAGACSRLPQGDTVNATAERHSRHVNCSTEPVTAADNNDRSTASRCLSGLDLSNFCVTCHDLLKRASSRRFSNGNGNENDQSDVYVKSPAAERDDLGLPMMADLNDTIMTVNGWLNETIKILHNVTVSLLQKLLPLAQSVSLSGVITCIGNGFNLLYGILLL
jgi:hypothetical protein